ncbi:hypothetical protein AC249_AIPGENE76 [Exaiptasia diaphana]|nr:hypothetical protein AC249_AIPGENE76 [Exaiptasia diaphana]
MTHIFYCHEEERCPRQILRLYNISWLPSKAVMKTLCPPKALTYRKLFGIYFHAIIDHAPLIHRIICLRSINAEQTERCFDKISDITKKTWNKQIEDLASNAFLHVQAEELTRGDKDEVQIQEKEIKKIACHLPKLSNIVVEKEVMVKRAKEWQAHLMQIADFLVPGPGVWWKWEANGSVEFFDSSKEPDSKAKGPTLHHFRSSSIKNELSFLKKSWEKCCHENIELPLYRRYDTNGKLVFQKMAGDIEENTGDVNMNEERPPLHMNDEEDAMSDDERSLPDMSDEESLLPGLPNAERSLLGMPNEESSLPGLPSAESSLSDMSNVESSLPGLPNAERSLSGMPNEESSLPGLPNAESSLSDMSNQISKEGLVENPSCHEKTLQAIKEWATYGEVKYVRTWEQIRRYSLEKLKEAKASWHRTCYKNAVHSGMLKRAKTRYESRQEGPSAKRKSYVTIEEASQLTRSKTAPYNKDVCFFCDGIAGYRQNLHNVSTTSAGESLRYAIQTSCNVKLQVKLNSAINPNDAHAIDIKYHKSSRQWQHNSKIACIDE